MRSILMVLVILLVSFTTLQAADSLAAWTTVGSMEIVVDYGFLRGGIDTARVDLVSFGRFVDTDEAINNLDSMGFEPVNIREFEVFRNQVVHYNNNLIERLRGERRGFLRIVLLSSQAPLLMDFDGSGESELFESDLTFWHDEVLFLVKKKD
ncbi:MAG: hypothetical protein Q8L36_03800 [bacterium]|nr:hypothetical protein [bacterium]